MGYLAVNTDASVAGDLSVLALVALDAADHLTYIASKRGEPMEPSLAEHKALV